MVQWYKYNMQNAIELKEITENEIMEIARQKGLKYNKYTSIILITKGD